MSPDVPETSASSSCYNVAFCYLPFVANDIEGTEESFAKTVRIFEKSDAWKPMTERANYLLRYICEKYDPSFPGCQCHHYRMYGSTAIDLGIGKASAWRMNWPDSPGTLAPGDCNFVIAEVGCYAFSTSVNILVYKLHFDTSDPLTVSTQLALLKKVRSTRIVPANPKQTGTLSDEALGEKGGLTLLEMSERILASAGLSPKHSFFFYANEGRERMNVLMHVEADETASELDAEDTLFYLGNCYNRSFDYDGEHTIPTKMHWASPSTAWAYSSEALACLTLPQRATSARAQTFVTSGFRYNFLTSYQFLYLMLLHQKYEYYRLLMSIGAGERRDRAQLERFRRELEVFRANFVFSRVSETQQYQYLYDMVARELKLDEMDWDVGKPIEALRGLRREDEASKRRAEEDAERESDRRIGIALNVFALLAGISALFDGFEFVSGYISPVVPPAVALLIYATIALVVVALVFFVIRQLVKVYTTDRTDKSETKDHA